jgi:hypothetical protein
LVYLISINNYVNISAFQVCYPTKCLAIRIGK